LFCIAVYYKTSWQGLDVVGLVTSMLSWIIKCCASLVVKSSVFHDPAFIRVLEKRFI